MNKSTDLFFNAALLVLYACLIGFGISHHELWGDEIHSWNIAKGSHSLAELFSNIRYEGHPPFWYLLLFGITQCTHALCYLKIVPFVFACATAFVFLFFSPFSRLQKILILCSYYFLFEYGVLARNYMPAVFFAFCLSVIYPVKFKYKRFVYYTLLLLLSNVHLLGLFLAASIHTAYCFNKKRDGKPVLVALVAGIMVLLPALYFILPPSDSQLNFQFWKDQWSVSRLYLYISVIVRSIFPLQDAGNIHWWNTSFLLDHHHLLWRLATLVVFLLLTAAMVFAVRKNKTAFMILATNLFLTFLLSLVFPLNTARYTGFVFVGLIVAAWFTYRETEYKAGQTIFTFLLFLQVPPAVFAMASDRKEIFSASSSVKEMHASIPSAALVATDYWCLNNLSAFLDTSVYCIELKRNVSFLVWNSEMRSISQFNYPGALVELMRQNDNKPFYFFSVHESGKYWADMLAEEKIRCTLVQRSGYTIEKSGQVFIYYLRPD